MFSMKQGFHFSDFTLSNFFTKISIIIIVFMKEKVKKYEKYFMGKTYLDLSFI